MQRYTDGIRDFIQYNRSKNTPKNILMGVNLGFPEKSTGVFKAVKIVVVAGLGIIGAAVAVPSCVVVGLGSAFINTGVLVVCNVKRYLSHNENEKITLGRAICNILGDIFIITPLMSCVNSAIALVDVTFLFLACLTKQTKMNYLLAFNKKVRNL